MKQYLELLEDIKNNGYLKENRTGTSAISVFGRQMRFNLSEGFPLVTTKKVHFKSIVHELLWFLKGQTNIKYLTDNKVRIWNEWADESGDLNKVYGHQWRSWGSGRKIVKVQRKDIQDDSFGSVSYLVHDKHNDSDVDVAILRSWERMIDACYNLNCKEYKNFGANGAKVCSRWLDASLFMEDAKTLKGWVDKRDNLSEFEIDKDYYGSNIFHPDVCSWTSKEDIKVYRKSDSFLATSPDGEVTTEISIKDYAKRNNIRKSKISKALSGKGNECKGFTFELIEDEWLYRYSRGVDQISNVIERIKSNPLDRRLIVSAWNVAEIDQMALPPCHLLFQFNCRPMTVAKRFDHAVKLGLCLAVENLLESQLDILNVPKYYLDCQLYIRSNDIFLGNPFNVASYALLVHMMAQVTNSSPGDFILTIGDAHIYENHLEQIDLQLTRDPHPLPQIKLNPEIKDIDDFKYEDIELVNYQSHATIKAKVAV